MSNNEPFEKKFEKAFVTASGGNIIFPFLAKQQMGKMVEEIMTTRHILTNPDNGILNTDQSFFIKGGCAAEEVHAHSFNLDAIFKGSNNRALTDRRQGWSEHEWQGQMLKRNDTPDIIISKDGKVIHSAQLKYNKDAASTAGEMSQVKDGQVKYADNDMYVGPSDQVGRIKDQSSKNIEINLSRDGDPVRREAYAQTKNKVTDRVSDGESSSTPMSKAEANELGQGNLEKLEQLDRRYQTKSTIQQMTNAAKNAAALSAVVCGSINVVRYVQLARAGTISEGEAVVKVMAETAAAATDSAVKAGANAGLQSLIVRYGGEQAVIDGLARQGAKNLLRTSAVTVGVVCAVDAIKDMVALGMGKITRDQFYERQGRGMLNTGAGVVGGTLGALGAEAGCLALGATSVPALVPLLGGLSGGLIAGIAMMVAIENGVEEPYRELMSNTGDLNSAAMELERLANNIFAGQVLFTKILMAEGELDKKLDTKMADIEDAGHKTLESIHQV